MLHNLYEKIPAIRTIKLNTQYFIFFPNRTDLLSYETFARRLGRKKGSNFMEVFHDILDSPQKFQYMLVDMNPRSSSKFMIRTNFLENEVPVGYMI